MGIKHFWTVWFKNKFTKQICKIKQNENKVNEIDNLLIDMNGIFHNSAQKIYEYGNFKPRQVFLLPKKIQKPNNSEKQLKVFQDVCENINKIISIINPKKRLILCIDGVAPRSKQVQQRQRRFLSALDSDSEERSFDSNCLTPGTKFMDHLSKYIDWYIKKQISSENENIWKHIEVIFSSEKVPGEGEHKCLYYIRKYGDRNESFCIHGMDADLIMLALGTHFPKIYILREDLCEIDFIDIGNVRKELQNVIRWESKEYDPFCGINDFIFMCFAVGNDFLPHIPAIEIIQGGIDFMIDIYKNVCFEYGHLTTKDFVIRPKALSVFLGTISQYEKGILEDKLATREKYFPDTLLEANSVIRENKYIVDIEKYRKNYYKTKLELENEKDIEKLCHDYIEGMQWVLTYYLFTVPNWNWQYKYHYAPFAYDLARFIETFKFPTYSKTVPTVPFIQLLCVLPPKSANLIPSPLNTLLQKDLAKYCPDKFKIDLDGKRQNWEGTVILPVIDFEHVEKLYYKYVQKVDLNELKRNVVGKTVIYSKSDYSYNFKSFNGDFLCKVKTSYLEL